MSWRLQKPIESINFQYFIQSQLFSGNFCAVHCQPADQIRAIYIEKNQQQKIVGLYNCTQQILHLHPRRLMFPHISMPRLFSNVLQLSGFLLIFLLCIFSLSSWFNSSFHPLSVTTDALYFTAVLGLILILCICTVPLLGLLYWPNFHQTSVQLRALQCANLDIEPFPASVKNAGIFKVNLNKNN
ncbi:hypothetical protein [Acinetobacter sp. ANC 5600]|uniref:hypothetical protein n=1 Tax=Acinetobacter sp. ANC 5600 TaxID=1960940 RepID=UPI000992F4B6|nr:hypothetical protein [Acinetobacter sp. ANC 5600]OOV79564.1 hypothetical protein B1201_15795 [Acinetobacter sp. ANC 5600]